MPQRLIRGSIRPYRFRLLIILLAMLVETAMSLASPWPLKVIIDNVVGNHKLRMDWSSLSDPCWTMAISCRLPDWLRWRSL